MKSEAFQEERNLITKVKKYLLSLGYEDSSLVEEYKINNKNFVDIAIFDGNNLIGIVEVKSISSLDLTKKEELPYNRTIRRAQSLSDENGCDFFLISNEIEHVWMQTSSTGRAIIISEIKSSKTKTDSKSHSKSVQQILSRALSHLKNNSFNSDYHLDFSIALTEFIERVGWMESTIPNDETHTKTLESSLRKKHPNYNEERIQLIYQTVEILLNSDILEIKDINCIHEIVSFIDEVIQKRNKGIYVPTWLNRLMLDMSEVKKSSKVTSIFSREGAILNIAFEKQINNISLIEANEEIFIWARLRARLLGFNDKNIILSPKILVGTLPNISNSEVIQK
ncbi:MAG: hypothetical protein JKY74_12535 [Shewanella sp.]|nr:hypothetical protein [Shewanella sp.]